MTTDERERALRDRDVALIHALGGEPGWWRYHSRNGMGDGEIKAYILQRASFDRFEVNRRGAQMHVRDGEPSFEFSGQWYAGASLVAMVRKLYQIPHSEDLLQEALFGALGEQEVDHAPNH